MKNLEQARAVLTSELMPRKEWFDDRSEWLEKARSARAKAHKAVEMAAEGAEELEVVMPAELVAALRGVSAAPAVHWVLDLVDKGVSVGGALALTEALNILQMEEDELRDQRPWAWLGWEVTPGGDLIWATGSGRTTFIFSKGGASLTRFAGGGSEVTGEWTFGPNGLVEGWVDPSDDRAEQLTYHLGGLGESPEDSVQVELAECEWVAQDLATLSHATWGKIKKKPARRNTEREALRRRRTQRRRTQRRHAEASKWAIELN